MILNVKRREMLALTKKTARAAPSAISNEELKGILLESDERSGTVRMTATNFEIAIQTVMPASIETGGSAVIDAGLFQGIFSLLPADDVYMELKPHNQMYIRSGGSHFQISVLPGSNYPKVHIPMPGDTVFVTGLKTLIGNVAFAVDRQKEGNAVMNCVNLKFTPGGLQASAGSTSSIVQAMGDKEAVGQISILVPASSLKLLASLSQDSDVYEVGLTGAGPTGKNIVFFDGTMTFSARLLEGKAMEIDQLISRFVPATTVEISADALRSALDAATVFASARDAIGITFFDTGLLLKCETDNGNCTNRVGAVIKNPPSKELYMNAHRLMDCVKTLDGTVTMSFSADGNLVIQTAKMCYLQPGTRPTKKKKETATEKDVAA